MAGKSLRVQAQVTVRNPSGDIQSFAPGDPAPDWLAEKVSNPAVLAEDVKPKPKSKQKAAGPEKEPEDTEEEPDSVPSEDQS